MSKPERESPLHCVSGNRGAQLDGVAIRALDDYAFLDLRGAAGDKELCQAVQRATGLVLPTEPNTFTRQENRIAFWQGPDQWLLLLAAAEEDAAEALLRDSHDGHFAVTAITSGQTIVSLAGPLAEEVIRKSSSYDLMRLTHDRCAQTVLAKTQVLIWQAGQDEYRLVVRRSYADYLYKWLCEAAR